MTGEWPCRTHSMAAVRPPKPVNICGQSINVCIEDLGCNVPAPMIMTLMPVFGFSPFACDVAILGDLKSSSSFVEWHASSRL
jgi:hypothetical protein